MSGTKKRIKNLPMQETISFVLDGKIQTLGFDDRHSPTTTVLNYLRSSPLHKGAKEGCAEGDCGACTVVIGELDQYGKLHYRAWDSCLVFLPMIHGKQLITVENLKQNAKGKEILHPVQESMVNCNGSQCGYCTPGIVMSLFALYKTENKPSLATIEDTLTGNLCRCTGYKPILEAAAKACVHDGKDQFNEAEKQITELLLKIKDNKQSLALKSTTQLYHQPNTKAEALELRKQYPDAILISGATDVALRVTKKHDLLKEIIDLSQVEEFKKSEIQENIFIFGAGMSLEAVKHLAEKNLPALHQTLVVFGSKQIRSLATLGGNIGSASPIGDTLPTLMAYDAELILTSRSRERFVNMNNFVLGYRKTELQPDELITGVRIPKQDKHTTVRFYKVSKRKDLDISTVSACFSLRREGTKVTEIRMAYGGMAAVTKRVKAAEDFLTGKNWERELIEQAMELIGKEFTPLSDARSGAAFRSSAAKNLLLKFWSETTEEA
jgi:xanthine dehydrogenase small subunit